MNTELLKLETGESVLRTVRKHWFVLFSKTFGIVIVGILPCILMTLWIYYDLHRGSDIVSALPVSNTTISFGFGAWLLIVWMALFGILTDYYLDMWLVTNKRIIAIDQQGFFRRSVASFRYERLQDITVEIDGFLPTLLDFGRIRADTAGHTDAFTIDGIPNPREIKSLMQEHADQVAPNFFTEKKQEPMP